MTSERLYLKLGAPSEGEALARMREGRKKALASIEMRFTVSYEDRGAIRKVVFDRQPTARDILHSLGDTAIVVSVEVERAPMRQRPLMLEPGWRGDA
jgi:hypothetical protein